MKKSTTATERLSTALEHVRRYTQHPRLEVQQLQLLLSLSDHSAGVAMRDAATELGVDPSFISRNTKLFGTGAKARRLIDQRIDDDNPRYRLISLTPDGHKVISECVALLEGEMEHSRLRKVADPRAKR